MFDFPVFNTLLWLLHAIPGMYQQPLLLHGQTEQLSSPTPPTDVTLAISTIDYTAYIISMHPRYYKVT